MQSSESRCFQLNRGQFPKDLTDELKWIAEGRSQGTLTATAPAKGIRALGKRALILGLGTLLFGAVIGGSVIWNLKPSPTPPQSVTRFVITLPAGDQILTPGLAISPDGNHLAYVTARGGIPQLFLRAMDSLEARPVPGTEGGFTANWEPFFSPDSQWLGFFANGKLKKVSVNGGAALTLADAQFPAGASWSSRGTIGFAPNTIAPLQEIPDAGGAPQPLTRFEKGDVSHRWPEFLPGGKAILFAAGVTSNWGNGQVLVQRVGDGERRNLVPGGMYPRFAPSGHLIYAQAGSLMAVPFDARRLEVSGTGVPVVEGVLQSGANGAADYSFSSTGTLVYVSGTETAQTKPVLVSRNGTEQPLAVAARNYDNPEFSPDGRRIAFTIAEAETQIWLYDVSKETLGKFTFDGANSRPLWTRDGKYIAFTSSLKGALSVFWQRSDGSGGLEQLTTSESGHYPLSFSPDGQLLAFVEINLTTQRDIWVLRLSDRKLQPFLRTRFNETLPRFSPDGRWMPYMSDESGRYEIYVQPFPGPGGKYQISSEGGAEPVWNPNGRELFYRSGDKMMSVDVVTQPSFSTGKPRALFEGRYLPGGVSPSYDISPDGQHFLMLKSVQQGQTTAAQIKVVLNWFEELKQKVPTGKK